MMRETPHAFGADARAGEGRSRRALAVAAASLALCVFLPACSSQKVASIIPAAPEVDPALGVAPSPRVVADGKPVPKGGGRFQTGKGYKIGTKTFTPTPTEPKGYSATGLASYYGTRFHGRRTANGEIFDHYALSAAHPTMPLPSYMRVTNLGNGKSVVVRVNDRGPFHRGRLIDVSTRTADLLGFKRAGVGRVKIEYMGLASLTGSDDRKLMATYTENGQSVSSSQLASLFTPPPPPAPPPPRNLFGLLPASQPAPAPQPTAVAAAQPAPQQVLASAMLAAAAQNAGKTPAPATAVRPVGAPSTAATPAVPAPQQVAARPAPVSAPQPAYQPAAAPVQVATRPAPAAPQQVAAARPAIRPALPASQPAPAPAYAMGNSQPAAAPIVPPPTELAVAPAPAGSNAARQRVLLSWGGLSTPMPLASPAPELPASATALGPAY